MDDMGLIFGLIGLGGGVYVLCAWFMMIKKGVINTTILLSKTVDQNKCRDKEAYIREASPKMLVMGIMAMIYGVCDIFGAPEPVFWTALGVLLVVLLWFGITTSKLKDKYF